MTDCNHQLPTFNPDGPCIEPISYRVDVTDMLDGERLSSCIVPARVIEGESQGSYQSARVAADSFWRRIMKAAGLVSQ